ncbi:MAG: hypothetical protein K0S65_3146 [Labilithrix sp.]|nr:hypothetical protein [Labilithrix sp.]
MTRVRNKLALASLLVGGGLAAAFIAACAEDRGPGFVDRTPPPFQPDATVEASTDCPVMCSLDGRSVVRSCTNEVIETCGQDLACGAGVCQAPCDAAAADRSSNGCEFYLQPPLFTKQYGQSCYAAYVVNTSAQPVDMALELEGASLDISKATFRTEPGDATLIPHTGAIAPGESIILFVSDRAANGPTAANLAPCPSGVVPAKLGDILPVGTGIGTSFHLKTNAPVSLAAIYPFGGAASYVPSATLLLPVATWGQQHLLVNAWERITYQPAFSGAGPSAHIVASEDDTEITIRPTHAIQDGNGVVGTAAQVPVTYRLGKGQVLQLNQAEELTGSIVLSNKPTSVFGGHECMFIPSARSACDTALQQLPPFEQWGSEYVGVGYRPRLGDESEPMPYRIVAARDGTRLDYDPAVPPGAPLTMSAGEAVTFWAGTGAPFVVRTQDVDHPIYLAAYMAGSGQARNGQDFLGPRDFQGKGDPEFVNIIPTGQYLSSYSFFADPTYEETSLVIVRAKTAGRFEDVWLECAGELTEFKPVGTRGDYEWLRVDLAHDGGPGQASDAGVCKNGLQRMKSKGAFTATLWGWAQYASYAYPGGMALRKLVQTPLPLIR